MIAAPPVAAALRVALIGNPNAGKTTLFNALTGLRQKVANYPGVTVERKEGWFAAEGREIHLVDLPGIYSLSARSPEESIAAGAVSGESGEAPDLLVVIVDATNLERHLYLASQLMDRGRPLILALNMMDLARARHVAIDVPALSRGLGVPVVPMSAATGEGVEDLKRLLAGPLPGPPKGRGRTQDGPPGREGIQRRYAWIREVCAKAVDRRIAHPHTLTERLDSVLTHRVWGLAIFAALMLLVFQALFSWAQAPMDLIDAGVRALGRLAGGWLAAAGLGGGSLEGLLVDGVISGVGAVLVFLPQILCLFFFFALLEDSGYLTRATFLMDRLMRGMGLHGKSFIPLMSSFACAIPGIMATRTIESRKDRLATILVAPLMSCSARLPVYTLMIGAFIPDRKVGGLVSLAALTMLSMYLLGVVAAAGMAWLFKKSLLKGPPPPFIMELPPYRMPRIKDVLLGMWDRSKLFLRRAGTVILAISIVLWFLASHPKGPVAQTYAGRIGHALAPAIAPLGFDWKLGVGLVTSFAAREMLVGTLGTLYGVEKAEEGNSLLRERLRADYAPIVGISVMVFFVLACQCMSTVAVVRRETNSWRWPLFMVAYMTALAWLGSFAVFQIGTRMGWGTA